MTNKQSFLADGGVKKDAAKETAVYSSTETPAVALDYHAVIICSSEDSCSLVQSLDDYAFLSNEAPRLPLSGCTVNCNCTYQHLEDRRHKIRREEDDGIHSFFDGPDLRLVPGRRSSDGPKQFPWTSSKQARSP